MTNFLGPLKMSVNKFKNHNFSYVYTRERKNNKTSISYGVLLNIRNVKNKWFFFYFL